MDEQARTLEHNETAEPHHNKNYCEYEKHESTLLSCIEYVATSARLHLVRDIVAMQRCLSGEQIFGITR
jgi:hypothetical protein